LYFAIQIAKKPPHYEKNITSTFIAIKTSDFNL